MSLNKAEQQVHMDPERAICPQQDDITIGDDV
jgi:hypothetical protein